MAPPGNKDKTNGRPPHRFKKGESGNPSGRPKKSVKWKDAEEQLREAIPRLMLLEKNELQKLLSSNPTGVEMLAAKYIHEHVPDVINRMLGKTPSVLTGKDGEPLIPPAPAPVLPPISFEGWKPEQIDKFIEATAASVAAAKKSA